MTPNEYQQEAARTECDQRASLARMMNVGDGYDKETGWMTINGKQWGFTEDKDLVPIRVNHSILGMINELGEVGALYQKWIYYGKQIPREELRQRFADEYGDLCWHMVEGLNALGLRLEDVLAANIRKLKARYPDAGWSQEKAQEENRDRAAEAKAQEGPGEEDGRWAKGWEQRSGKPLPIKWVSVDVEDLKKLQTFKEYVHKRLDEAGVPAEVPGKSLDEGCRIAGRLDWVFNKLKGPDPDVKAAYNEAMAELDRAEGFVKEHGFLPLHSDNPNPS